MDLKEQYNDLVKTVKRNMLAQGQKITNGELAKRLGLSRTYFSGLLGGSKEVSKKHISDFKSHFRDELIGMIRPNRSEDDFNLERAFLKVLGHRLAKVEAMVTNRPLQDILKEIEQDTILVLHELERK